MTNEAFQSGINRHLADLELMHVWFYDRHCEGNSPSEIQALYLALRKGTFGCSEDCIRANLKNFGVTKFNKRKKDVIPPKKTKKRERKNSLGPSSSWDRTIRILSLILQDSTQGDVKRKLKTHRTSVSRIVGNATAAGFNCDPYVGTKNGTVNNALMRSVYLLTQGWAIKDVAKEVKVYAKHLRKIQSLMKKHKISNHQKREPKRC